MDTFRGTMRVEGEQATVPVEARIDELRLVLVVEGVEVGAWALAQVSAERTGAGVLLDLGADRVELDVGDRSALLAKFEPATEEKAVPRRERRRRHRRRISMPLVVTLVLFAAVVTAGILFPEVTGAVLLLLGAALLIVGALGFMETRIALRLPLGLLPVHFILGGAFFVLVGAGLTLLG